MGALFFNNHFNTIVVYACETILKMGSLFDEVLTKT